MPNGRGWHGERKRHSDAARKNIPRVARLPVQAMDTDIVELVKVLRFLRERRKYLLEDRFLLGMLDDRILLKEEQLKAELPKRQVELIG